MAKKGRKRPQKIVPMSQKPASTYVPQGQPNLQDALLTQKAIIETAKKQEIDGQTEYTANVALSVQFINDHANEIADYVESNICMNVKSAPVATMANPVYKRTVAVATMKESRIHEMINAVCGTSYEEKQVPVVEALAAQLIISTSSDITNLIITTAIKRNPEILRMSFDASIEEDESKAIEKIFKVKKAYEEVISDDEIHLLYRKFLF